MNGTETAPAPSSAAPLYMSLPLLTAVLISLIAMSLVAPATLPMTLPFLVAVLASYRFPARMDGRGMGRWILRLVLIGTAVTLMRSTPPVPSDYLVGAAWGRNFFGIVYGAEMTIQVWRARSDNPRALLLVAFFSGLLYLVACNSFDNLEIRLGTPFYVLALVLGMRTYRVHRSATDPRSNAAARRAVGVAIFLAIGLGAVTQRALYLYRGDLMDWGNNLLMQRAEEMLDSSGMSDEPDLGPTFGLRGSPARVLRLTTDSGKGDYSGDPHLRGLSFDSYTAGRWGPAVSSRYLEAVADRDIKERRPVSTGAISTYNVKRLSRGNPLVYAPLNVSEIDLTDAFSVQWAPASGGPIRTSAPPPFTYSISVPGNQHYPGLLANPPTASDRKFMLQVPNSVDKRVVALARVAVDGATTDSAKIDRVVSYLMRHHTYSLSYRPGPGDPVSEFLLTDGSAAHCEYFASSAALMLRCVGVPSRYVTGYYLHEISGPGVYIVRQRDAHAWAEAWVKGVGWETVDATPGDGLPDHDPPAIDATQRGWEWIQDQIEAVQDWLGGLSPDQINLAISLVTAGAVAGGVIWMLFRRQSHRASAQITPAFAYTLPSPDAALYARRIEIVLAAYDLLPAGPDSWLEYVTARLPDSAPFVRAAGEDALILHDRLLRCLTAYERLRFGETIGDADTLSGHDTPHLDQDLDILEATMAQPAARGRANSVATHTEPGLFTNQDDRQHSDGDGRFRA